MPRAPKTDNKTMQRLLLGVASEVRKGTLDKGKANTMIAAFKAVMYGNQLNNNERRLVADEQLVEYQKQMIDYMEGKRPLPPPVDDFIKEAVDNEGNEPENP